MSVIYLADTVMNVYYAYIQYMMCTMPTYNLYNIHIHVIFLQVGAAQPLTVVRHFTIPHKPYMISAHRAAFHMIAL